MANAVGLASLAREALRRQAEQREAAEHAERELERCRTDFAYFVFRHCRTVDEHDPTVFAKPFPRLEYLRDMAYVLQHHRRIAIEKSRQVMASWLCCAFTLWVAMFHPNILAFVQSKKEEDAADRLDRIYKLYFRLPEFFRERFPINQASGRPGQQMYKELHFTWMPEDLEFFQLEDSDQAQQVQAAMGQAIRSKIQAIPQGADVVRQFTASLIFSDEDAFQALAGEAYAAYMPTLAEDSWVIKVSTANPGHFESICKDREVR